VGQRLRVRAGAGSIVGVVRQQAVAVVPPLQSPRWPLQRGMWVAALRFTGGWRLCASQVIVRIHLPDEGANTPFFLVHSPHSRSHTHTHTCPQALEVQSDVQKEVSSGGIQVRKG